MPRPTVFVAFDGLQSLDLAGPWEVLATAARIAGSAPELVVATPEGRSVTAESGLRVAADVAVESVASADTLIVVGGEGTRAAARDERFVAEVRRLAGSSRRVASVCTGAFVLAAAGLLDGRRATTHWLHCASLARRHPEVEVEPDSIYVRDGDLNTSAGVTAGIDLALALAEEDRGREVALETARMLVVPARREGGQSQFSVQVEHGRAERRAIRELQAHIADSPADDLSVGALAGRVHLSERQLSRVFHRELGATPAGYVERSRIERARGLLEGGDEPLERVAGRSGFASAEVMRRAFQRRVGTSPSAYRARFRIKETNI
jgi:transcriptional regulator GlxA family with amidase domain